MVASKEPHPFDFMKLWVTNRHSVIINIFISIKKVSFWIAAKNEPSLDFYKDIC